MDEVTALAFVDAVERSIRRIGRNPNIGSLRVSYDLGIPGVRAWPVEGFPHVVFYAVGDDQIDVWRIVRSRRDVPAWLFEERG